MIYIANKAIDSELTPVHMDGKDLTRLMIILRTKGCSYSKKTGGCVHCSLLQNAMDNITTENLKQQFQNEIIKYNKNHYQHVEVLTLGSFFDDEEIPEEVMEFVLETISHKENVSSVLIESRPEYITTEKIKLCKKYLGSRILEIGIGVESTNDYVRDSLIKKGYTINDIESALSDMSDLDVNFLGYVLVKPPGLSEKECIDDSIQTIRHIFTWGIKYDIKTRIALQPFYVPRDSYAFNELNGVVF